MYAIISRHKLTVTVHWNHITIVSLYFSIYPIHAINVAPYNFWGLAYHLQGSSEDAAQKVGVDECAVVIWQLHKVYQWIILENKGKLISCRAPVGHAWGDS